MVSADLQGLVAAHEETDFSVFLVFKQLSLASTTLSPLLRLQVEAIQLRTTVRESL